VDEKLNREPVVQVDVNGAEHPSLTKAYWRCRRHVGFATVITSNQLLSNRAWSAGAAPPMLII
jgi:hypothetical protein